MRIFQAFKRFSWVEDGAKVVTERVDTKAAEAIP